MFIHWEYTSISLCLFSSSGHCQSVSVKCKIQADKSAQEEKVGGGELIKYKKCFIHKYFNGTRFYATQTTASEQTSNVFCQTMSTSAVFLQLLLLCAFSIILFLNPGAHFDVQYHQFCGQRMRTVSEGSSDLLSSCTVCTVQ